MRYTLYVKPENDVEWDTVIRIAQDTGLVTSNILIYAQSGVIIIPFDNPVTLARFAALIGGILAEE